MGSELRREKADKSFGERVGEGEGRRKETKDRADRVHVNGKSRRRFMEKEEEALCFRRPPVPLLLLRLSVRRLGIIHHHVL